MKLGMKKCDKSTSSQQEQFESWMGSIEAISNLIIEAREEIDNDRCLPKKVLNALHNAKIFRMSLPKKLGVENSRQNYYRGLQSVWLKQMRVWAGVLVRGQDARCRLPSWRMK